MELRKPALLGSLVAVFIGPHALLALPGDNPIRRGFTSWLQSAGCHEYHRDRNGQPRNGIQCGSFRANGPL